jgi:2-dehydro-3-deoxygluconokinase
MIKIVTFGETLAQRNATYIGPYSEDGDYMLDCAGAESNVAVDLRKLCLANVETIWVSNVGDDGEGEFILRELKDRTSVAARVIGGRPTGISYLNHLPDGQHVKTYRRKGSAASLLTFQDIEPHLMGADLLHVTGITPALSDACRQAAFDALDYASKRRIPISFDLNYRPQLWGRDEADTNLRGRPPRLSGEARAVFERMLGHAAIFKLGHDEAEAVWAMGLSAQEYARRFQEMNKGIVVVTRGAHGAIAYDGVNWVDHPGFVVEVVDPVGAGDAFVAGLLGGILESCTPREFLGLSAGLRQPILGRAIEIANAAGALTCTRRGDTAAMPTMAEVRGFIAAQQEARPV